MRFPRILLKLLVIGFAVSGASLGQPPASSKGLEVVSIKPNKSGTSGGIQRLPDGERYLNTTLDIFIKDAYGSFSEDQVIAMPLWTNRTDMTLK